MTNAEKESATDKESVLETLLDREAFLSKLDDCIEQSLQVGRPFALFVLSIDGFKAISANLRREVCEDMLEQVCSRVQAHIRGGTGRERKGDRIGRLAEDEFGILASNVRDEAGAVVIAERLNRVFMKPFELGGESFVISVSIGIALGSEDRVTGRELLGRADSGMHRALQAGKAQHAVFDQAMQNESRHKLKIENALRSALGNGEIELCYQPIVDLETGRISSFESLVRWCHKDFGKVCATEIIPLAEEVGLMVPLGAYVFRKACEQLRSWLRMLPDRRDLYMNINVSKRQLSSIGFLTTIRNEVAEQRVIPERINLEVTESSVVESSDRILEVMHELRLMGFRLQLDDFGTGLSSLSNLHLFPVDLLKIDRSFIVNMESRRDYSSLVHAIISLALNLNLKVTAEGIESTNQLAQVLSLGCHYGQGYLFARPLNVQEATEMLRSGTDFQAHLPVHTSSES